MKRYLKEILFTSSLILFTVFCYFQRMKQGSDGEFNILLFELSKGNQICQIACVLFLFVLGLITLLLVNQSFHNEWLLLLAYPVGLALWGGMSCIVLCIGIKYNLFSMMVVLVLAEVALGLLSTKRKEITKEQRVFLIRSALIIIGVVCVVSIGVMYTFSSHDTHYYIDKWGRSIYLEEGLSENFKTYMLSTGLAPATISSLMCMMGGDVIYAVHHCLIINFYVLFAYVVYKESLNYIDKKKSLVYAVMSVCCMVSIPAIQLLSGWIISNTYIMIYSFLLIVLFRGISQFSAMPRDYKIVLTIIIIFVTFLRADAPIYMGCLFVCLSITQIQNKDIVLHCILPSALSILFFYTTCCILFKNNLDGMFLMPGTMLAILGLYGVLLIWFCLIRKKRMFFVQKKYTGLVLGILLFLIAVIAVYKYRMTLEIVKVYLYNFTSYSLNAGWWAMNVVFILLLCFAVYERGRECLSLVDFYGLLLYEVTFALGMLRALMEMSPRRGFGDSFNRAFISYLPIIVYAIVIRVLPMMKKEISKGKV